VRIRVAKTKGRQTEAEGLNRTALQCKEQKPSPLPHGPAAKEDEVDQRASAFALFRYSLD